jgi:periplasmic divalent cation tolerance protein
MARFSIVFVSAPSEKEAKKITQALLKAKLVACVNIIKGIKSFFWWQGNVTQAREVMLVIKTRKALFAKVERIVRKHHSYEVPEIISFSLEDIAVDYRRWLDESIPKSA